MQYLYSLQEWLEGTQFYQEYLVQMPAPLNSIYFDTLFTAFIVILLGYWIIDYIRAIMDHNHTKKMQRNYEKEKLRKHQQEVELEEQRARKRQLELDEKRAENEIHALNHEREARNQREEMNQFMRYVEMSMIANSTQKPSQSFDSFKSQEKHVADKQKHEKVQDTFDTVDSDAVPAAQIAMMDDDTKAENERMMAEIKALREDKARMKKAFAAKDKEREEAISRVKQQMAKTEQEKQTEIDNLSQALEKEKAESKQKMAKMAENQRIFQKKKEQELADLKANLPQTLGADRDAKQAEIIRLTDEMNRLKKETTAEIAAKEKELTQITSQKEKQIADLQNEITNMKNSNAESITKLSSALQNAQAAQKNLEHEKQVEIDRLTAKSKQLLETKQAELSAIKQEKQQSEEALKSKLSVAEQENAKKQAELSAVKQEKQQTEKALSAIKQENATKQATIDKLTKQVANKSAKDATVEQKNALQSNKQTDATNIRPIAPGANGAKQLAHVVKTNMETAPAANGNAMPKANASGPVQKDISAITPEEKSSQPDVMHITKPTFGIEAAETEVLNTSNDFEKMISTYSNTSAQAKQIDRKQEMDLQQALSRKEELQQNLVVEAEIEDQRDIHEEDDGTNAAIDERKQKVLKQVEQEKQRENKPKKSLFGNLLK